MSTFIRGFARGGLAAAFVVLVMRASAAHAVWSADPVTVTPTTASIPLVEGCSDGAYGTFAAWQEGSPTGILRAQHLLPNGDLDPTWPSASTVACSFAAARSELVALPDRLGGLYLLWKEGVALYATRIDPSGAVAAGWPARGRSLGDVFTYSPRPGVIEDGAHGFYAVWVASNSEAVGIHLGPANTGAGGWQNGVQSISYYDEFATWAQLAPAPDGGLFVAWASYGEDAYGWTPGSWKLKRLTAAGLTAAGWPDEGKEFGDFHYEYIGDWPSAASLLALAEDGRGGAFLMIGNPMEPGYEASMETRLYRLLGNGQSALDWPAEGVVVPHGPYQYWATGSAPDDSYRLLSDEKDGVYVGAYLAATDNASRVDFRHCSADAQFVETFPAWGPAGYEMVSRGDGGFYMAYFGCCFYVYQLAYIQAAQFPIAPGIFEEHTESFGDWYSDIGLALTDDGGAVFLWSQVQGRVGLFARRINSAREVTAVEPGARPAFGLTGLRFVPGEGVRVAFSLPGSGSARFEVFDLAGRRIASRRIEAGAREITIAGTATLPSGLYFGRLTAGAESAAAKLIVAR